MNEVKYQLITEVSKFKKVCLEFKRVKKSASYKYEENHFNCREAVQAISEAFNKVEAEYNAITQTINYADRFILVGNDGFIAILLTDMNKMYAEVNAEFLDYVNSHSKNTTEAQLTRKGLGLTGRIG